MASNSNVKEGSTSTYTFDGLAFNNVRPYINNVNFHQAMAWLTSYSFLQTTVLSGVAGTASINFLPCTAYPGACYSGKDPYYVTNAQTDLLNAAKSLVKAGLVPGNSAGNVVTLSASTLSTITNWYKGSTFYNAVSNPNGKDCTGTAPLTSDCIFSPLYYYRSDDPLRANMATQQCSTAKGIGLQINCQGITGHAAGADVYGESGAALVTPGLYNAATGYNTPPVYDPTAVNGTSTSPASDTWDMYTFGWITSPYYNWTWYFFNSQGPDNSGYFTNYYNPTVDYLTNALYYASSNAVAAKAATTLAKYLDTALPYLMGFYQNTLYAAYTNGWTGYANLASTGPDTGTGLFYTLLNVHQTSSALGGTFQLALHEPADQSGMNPLYSTNWVWQADIYGEIYDGPLAAPPVGLTTVNDYMNWMTTGGKDGPKLYNTLVSSYNKPTGTGAGWTNDWQPGSTNAAHNIVNGQVITLNFRNNVTFTDNVPVTAYDYNFSLYAWDLTGNSGSYTPLAYAFYGSLGLISTYIPPTNPYQIQLYVNSSTIWNLSGLDVLVLPQHILGNFNMTDISSPAGAVDLTQPSTSTATGAAASDFCGTGCMLKDPLWMQYLPNLEVGSGPFYLYTYSGVTSGAGVLKANPNYDRTPWTVIAANDPVSIGSSYSFSTNIQEFTYVPTGGVTTFGGDSGTIAVGSTGYVGITNATGSIQLYTAKGVAYGNPIPLGSSTTGTYTVSIPTTGLPCTYIKPTPAHTTACPKSGKINLKAGAYEIVVTANYNFLGLPRTWYQASGFTVSK